MESLDERIRFLTNTLLDEIVHAVGLRKTATARKVFSLFFRKATHRLAEIGVKADQVICTDGFPAGCRWMMSHWVRDVVTRGAANIPTDGPLLVVSNHVGAYDIVVVPSQVNRPDLKIIASDIPYLMNLPAASEHLIFTSIEGPDRWIAARAGINHLQEHGSLLLFGTGAIDPDPEFFPQAEEHIDNWSPSIDLFLHKVPETLVILAIASGFLTHQWLTHPLTRLRRVEWEKHRLAEFGQVLQQLFRPGKLFVTPHVSFSPPYRVDELRRESGTDRVLPAIIARGKALLVDHKAALHVLPTL
jgi:hypothetical protein